MIGQQNQTHTAETKPTNGWVAIVANPYSGGRPNAMHVERLVQELTRRQMRYRVLWEPTERRGVLSAAHAMVDCRCVIAAGGDGTLADVLVDLARFNHVPIGVLPLGNENLFAKHVGFSGSRRGVKKLADAIERGHSIQVDAGHVNRYVSQDAEAHTKKDVGNTERNAGKNAGKNVEGVEGVGGRVFSSVVSVGFDAEVVRRLAHWRSQVGPNAQDGTLRRVSDFSYVQRTFGAVRSYAFPQIELTANEQTVRGTLAMVFNVPRYAAGLPIAPHAQHDDGLLDWVVFERPGVVNLIHYGWLVVRGKHLQRTDVHHGRSAHIHITSDHETPVQIDGDSFGYTPIEIKCTPRTIRILNPTPTPPHPTHPHTPTTRSHVLPTFPRVIDM